ncbi:MAG: hypothetical protein HYX63_05300 [Gammaproteobacteria bacterium]|nr:hypothetical protein [Gammaproteobacteria bacterium]
MSFISNSAFQARFVKALNGNPSFVEQALCFDGSVLLEVGADRLWLKVYKGKVIDHQTAVPVFGYTFKFVGTEAAWKLLLSGKRRWADLTFPGKRYFDDDPDLKRVGELSVEIATEGNLLEAGRLTEAMFQLAYTLQKTAAARAA